LKIISESGVAAGVRRLEVLTGEGAHVYISDRHNSLSNIVTALKATPENAVAKVLQLQDQLKLLQRENLSLQKTIATGGSGSNDIESKVQEIAGVKLFAIDMQSVDKLILRDTIDGLKSKYDNAIVLLATRSGDKTPLVAGVSKAIVKSYPAGKLIQHVTGLFDGRGGGRPDMAEGGIPNESDIEECLKSASAWVENQS
jgi:alanyl-tRNA synthetase